MSSPALIGLTLYKHGVGYFQRSGPVQNPLTLLFDRGAMNDVLKSLTVSIEGSGHLLGVEFDTPETDLAAPAGRAIKIESRRALRDLIEQLRGSAVDCLLQEGDTVTGQIFGLDETDHEGIEGALFSLYDLTTGELLKVKLNQILKITLHDRSTRKDVAFFLEQAQHDDRFGTLKLRFSPETENAAVSYVAPAPTWRLSYRLVTAHGGNNGSTESLFQGWAIFDNTLDEPLEEITLSLISGMPISFTYGLYQPHTPDRPHFVDEDRVIEQEVTFEAAAPPRKKFEDFAASAPLARAISAPGRPEADILASAVEIETEGIVRGEQFEYRVTHPVSVGRGRSAMVPIFQVQQPFSKRLIYNYQKVAAHPVAVFEGKNLTGGPLERGPVTVFEENHYLGDALINFTPAAGRVVIPYAIELGVDISFGTNHARQKEKLYLKDAFLVTEEWDIRTTTYQIHNKLPDIANLIIEHPRQKHYNLETTPRLIEETNEYSRLAVSVDGQTREVFRVTERRLITRRQSLSKLSWRDALQAFKDSLLDERSRSRVRALLDILEPLEKREAELAANAARQDDLAAKQKQIQGNLASLGMEGKEGALRLRYIESLEKSEDQLVDLERQAEKLRERIETLKNLLTSQLQTWVEKNDAVRSDDNR